MLQRLVVASLLCACGTKHVSSVPQGPPIAAEKFPEGPPRVTIGERMSYRLALSGMELGTYEMAVGEITTVAGKQTVVVQAHAKSMGLAKAIANVNEVFTSWIDIQTGRPVRWTVDEVAPKTGDKEHTEAKLHERTGNSIPIEFTVNDKPLPAETQTVSLADTWDYNAYLVALRAWEAPLGSTVKAEILRSRYLWQITTTIGRKEKLVTELGEFPALRFEGKGFRVNRDGQRDQSNPERTFTIWISDDGDRVPLQTVAETDYGDIKIVIVEYQPGSGQRLRP